MNIVFATDENYIPHMGVAMTSILMNSSPDEDIHFYVLVEAFPEEQKKKIEGLKTSIRDFKISFLEGCEASDFDNINRLGDGDHVTLPAYFRIKIGSLLKNLHRVLYLDCDIVVRTSLKPLWESGLGGKTLGAVENLPACAGGMVEKEIAFLGVQRYFNTGVLLLDLKQWRGKGYEEKLLNVDDKILETTTLHDQSLMNAVLGGDVAYLDQAWNYLTFLPLDDFKRRYPGKMKMAEPGIIHFAGRKPWAFEARSPVPFAEEYWKYRAISPWKWKPDAKWYGQVAKHCWRHPRDAVFFGLKKIGSWFKGHA